MYIVNRTSVDLSFCSDCRTIDPKLLGDVITHTKKLIQMSINHLSCHIVCNPVTSNLIKYQRAAL